MAEILKTVGGSSVGRSAGDNTFAGIATASRMVGKLRNVAKVAFSTVPTSSNDDNELAQQ